MESKMAEIPISVATNIVQKLVDQAINETRYLCCFSNIAEDYENEKKKLTTIQMNVDDHVKEARDKNEEIVIDVKDWQSQAANMTREDIDTKAKKNCFFGLLPNCIWLYRRGKDLDRKAQKIKNLIESSKFDKISRPSTLPGVEFYSSEDFMQFESRNLAQNELHEVLKNGDNYMTGLHGAGGSGKTKLVIQVGKEVQKPELFEKVIFVVVSSTPNVRKIQDEIASALGCSLNGDEFERPKKLWSRLRNGQKILIILDDVWEKLKLEDIGIPSRDNHEGCYVLLTTRDSKVCDSMGCQKIIHLNLLPKTEAWILFQRFAVISDASTALKDVAREIAYRCKGLPVAITTMARTLKGHPLKDWKDTLRALRSSTTIDTIDEELKDIYKCLRVSHDNLKSEEAKRLFLLCSMFPQDHKIPLEEIIRYGIGSGLFGELDPYHTRRYHANSAVDKLTRSCLLLKAEDEGYAKMHDLIHDVAHLIAKNEIQEIVEPKSTLKALQEDTAMKQNEIRYLYCHYIKEFVQLDLQNLEILILVCNNLDDGMAIPDAFFDGMKGLKVLTLRVEYQWSHSIKLMARSLGLLKNLRTLNLRKCNLGDISVLETLQKIETLELYQCAINELPKGIVELKKLRLFRLESCKIKGNPYKVIGRFSKIEELYIVGNIISSGEVDSGVVADLFDKNRISPALERYHIEIGVDRGVLNEYLNESMSRALSIGDFDASVSNATINDLMQKAEILCLHKLERGSKSISPDFFEAIGGAMSDLIKLGLYNCSQIECLFDTSKLSSSSGIPTNFLEKLEHLTIVGCNRLKNSGLFVGNLNLRTLRELQFRSCPELTYLFTFSIAQSLMLLEVLEVKSCDAMKCLIKDEIEEIAEVDHDQGTTMDSMFPKLKHVTIWECGQLECFSSVDSNQRQLSDLTTSSSNSSITGSIQEHPSIVTPPSHTEAGSSLQSHSLASLPKTFPQSINRSVQEHLASTKAEIVTPSSIFELESSLVAPLLTSASKVSPQSERRESQKGTCTRGEKEAYHINLQDLENDDLIALFQSVEEDAHITAPTPSTEDFLVTRVLSDLEVLLKMPFKDIANSDANILNLRTALNFLSRLSLEDGALSEELKTIIHSLHQNFPTILASFKQASSQMDRFALLEQREESIKQEMARQKDQAPILVSNISKTKRFVDEAAQMQARLNEEISKLQEELNNIGNKIKDCKAQLSALEEQKKECIAETIEFKKELEDLKKEKSQTVEDQRKARQILVDADYKWSALCSQFQQNHILAGNN